MKSLASSTRLPHLVQVNQKEHGRKRTFLGSRSGRALFMVPRLAGQRNRLWPRWRVLQPHRQLLCDVSCSLQSSHEQFELFFSIIFDAKRAYQSPRVLVELIEVRGDYLDRPLERLAG